MNTGSHLIESRYLMDTGSHLIESRHSGDGLMQRASLRTWMKCLLMVLMLISGCSRPLVSRLVTIETVKPPEVDTQRVKIIGVLPFKSPEQTVGRQLQKEMVKGLTGEMFLALTVQVDKNFQPNSDAFRKLAKEADVNGLLLGEITEYSVLVSTDTIPMLALREFGTGEPAEYGWLAVNEDPSIGDIFYYSLENLQRPNIVQVYITRMSYSLAVHLRLIEATSGSTIWEKEISRHLERFSLPGRPVNTEAEIRRIQISVVKEAATHLRPQESTVQRMLRGPLITIDPKVTKLIRKGIDAAARNNWGQAESLFLQVLEKDPDKCTIIGNLGVVYEKSGRFLEALAAYERAYRCQPRDPTYRYYSDDLQTAFAPDLSKEDLPTVVLGGREDGVMYLDGGENRRHHPGDTFVIYRAQSIRDRKTAEIKTYVETELARGEIIEVREQMSLGRLLLYDPEREVRRGDMVRFEK
jgi:tetratricopeptide (TPR) repeat protein